MFGFFFFRMQVASGSNLIYFITGNGSITNFPFVPTVKIVTTTPRFRLLERDMDVNAGRYLAGTPMAQLGAELLELSLRVCTGQRTAGERAGHAQVRTQTRHLKRVKGANRVQGGTNAPILTCVLTKVQIWRNWALEAPVDLAPLQASAALRNGTALQPAAAAMNDPDISPLSKLTFDGVVTARPQQCKHASDQLALILPTSVCSGQIAALIANRLNDLLEHT